MALYSRSNAVRAGPMTDSSEFLSHVFLKPLNRTALFDTQRNFTLSPISKNQLAGYFPSQKFPGAIKIVFYSNMCFKCFWSFCVWKSVSHACGAVCMNRVLVETLELSF